MNLSKPQKGDRMKMRHYLNGAFALVTLAAITNVDANKSAKDMMAKAATVMGMAEGRSVTIINKTDQTPIATAYFAVVGVPLNQVNKVDTIVGHTAIKNLQPVEDVNALNAGETLYAKDAVDAHGANVFKQFSKIKKVRLKSITIGAKTKNFNAKKHPEYKKVSTVVITTRGGMLDRYRIETMEEFNARMEKEQINKASKVHKNK